jgi:hypothetical protein
MIKERYDWREAKTGAKPAGENRCQARRALAS